MAIIKNIFVMFSKTLDEKSKFIDENGDECIDLTEGIFSALYNVRSIHSIYRVDKHSEMRPDYIAAAVYGDEAYTEMIMKSSAVVNPFAIERDDLIFTARIDSIYDGVKDSIMYAENTGIYDMIKNYHKYIDKSKIPDAPGSEKNKVSVSSEPSKVNGLEPNISKTGKSGIVIKNGKIYFGENQNSDNSISDYITDNELKEKESAIGTGSLPYSESEDIYNIGGNISVDENNKIKFNVDDTVDELISDNIKDSLTNANNIFVNNGKVEITSNDEPSAIDPGLIINVDSDKIDCGKTGISLGELLVASVNNNCANNDME